MATINETDARLNSLLTQSQLKEYLSYDVNTGVFSCIKASGYRKVGDRVGNPNGKYIQIGICGERHRAHRLAWLYIYGCFPKEIDHINGDGRDNRICNLREVTHQENSQNHVKPPRHNSSGYLGVSFFKGTNRYSAYIQADGKKKHLGYFDNSQQAHNAYLQAKRALHPTCSI